MKYIVPAKCNSIRVPNKNWRPFYHDLSLVDILIEKLLKCGVDPEEVYVSCESLDRLNQVRDRWKVSPILRSKSLCDNNSASENKRCQPLNNCCSQCCLMSSNAAFV